MEMVIRRSRGAPPLAVLAPRDGGGHSLPTDFPGYWLTFRLLGDLVCEIDVRIEEQYLQTFLDQLASVEGRRMGCASLVAEQAVHFTLTVSVVDKRGHVALTVEVSEPTFVAGIPFENELVVTSELDPGVLPQLLTDFRAFAASLTRNL